MMVDFTINLAETFCLHIYATNEQKNANTMKNGNKRATAQSFLS
jgi:hypothetical protein